MKKVTRDKQGKFRSILDLDPTQVKEFIITEGQMWIMLLATILFTLAFCLAVEAVLGLVVKV